MNKFNIRKMKIKSIKKVVLNKPKKFYDITVDKYHNFLITKDNLVTHNTSLEDTIIGMGQPFKNNIQLLEIEGQWGFLRVPQAGASRYIGCNLHSNFYEIFKDFNLTEKQLDEGKEIEPKFYLPIIPMILINGTQGIAVGFASKILNRDPKRIIDVSIKHLQGEKYLNTFKPYLKGFKGSIIQDPENSLKWHFKGIYEKVNTSTIRIVEYSPDMTYEKIEKLLQKKDDNKEIVSYENNSKENVDITVKFRREVLSDLSDEQIRKVLSLDSSVTENLTLLDENEKIKIFPNVIDIIKYFIEFRLTYYTKRKNYLINFLKKNIIILVNKAKFIKAIIDKKLKINNIPKDKVIASLEKMNFDKIDDSFSYLLSLSIYSLTKELYDKLKIDLKNKKEELKLVKKRKEKDMYIEDLEVLKNNLK